MKRIVNVVETTQDGLEKLLGEYVQLWCVNYIYAGKLTGVNATCVVLTEAGVVYETGKLDGTKFQDFQQFAHEEHFVQIGMIESFSLAPGLVK